MKRVLAVMAVIAGAAALSAADWTRFRGPNGTGVVADPTPVKFDLKTNQAWKTEIPGKGVGSPIVVKGKVFLQSAADTGTKRHLTCVDATTGKVEWTADVDAAPPATKVHVKNTAASGTPCTDGERVYAAFWKGNALAIHAFDFAGKPVWDTPLGKFASEHGAAHSPMVFDGKVYFNFDQDGAAELVALDAKTGKEAWRKSRKANRSCYTTPFVLEEPGKPTQLIIGSTTCVTGYDPKSGDVLWNYALKRTDGGKDLRSIGQQVIAGGNVITYCGEGGADRYMVAVKLGGKGDISATGKAWDMGKGKTPYVPSMIAYKDHLYWITDAGQAGCAEAKTGKVLWSEEKVFELAVSASPILIGDTILTVDEKGHVASFKASPKGLGDVEKSELGQPVFATPAAANGKLFLRGGKFLFCIGGKTS
jgi:outer membrane protein assembly factor BamB